MTVQLSKSTKGSIQNIANMFHVSEDRIVERAVHFYLNAIKDEMNLKNEMDAWDKLSDDALLKFGYY